MAKIVPVILCGGSGSRLWPVSRANYPKPFVTMENGRTLFMDTLERVKALDDAEPPIIVCNEAHRFYVMEALAKCELEGRIILEPEGRNTAPATALAAFALMERTPRPLMLVMPSDHTISQSSQFCAAVADAVPTAANGRIAIFGVKPTRPECGYGYIQTGQPLDTATLSVQSFIEKPEESRARAMLQAGGYFWNSGIFLMSAAVYLDELQKFAPQIYSSCAAAWQGAKADMAFIRPDADEFQHAQCESIDYAIMEHTKLAAMLPLNVSWNDLGSWQSFYEVETKDENGNVKLGDVLVQDTCNCYLHARDRLLAVMGMENLVVVETRDAVLVVQRNKCQNVKKFVEKLKADGRKEYQDHAVVYRPWGSYETLSQGPRFQVKRIIVKPGGKLSLQLHHHRAEHWVVVKGTAVVRIDQDERFLTENQSVYIPVGSRHKLENPGIIPLEIVEIQSGSYLGEDDIKRFDDAYGRK